MDHSQATGTALLVLLAIARTAGRTNAQAYLRVDTLAKRARVTRRNVQKALRELEALGELHSNIMGGRAGVNLYTIDVQGSVDLNRVATDAPRVATDTGGASDPTREGRRIRLGRGVATDAQRESSEEEESESETDSDDESSDAEPHSGRVAAPDAGLRPSLEGAAATGAEAPGFTGGLPPPLTPFRALALDAEPWKSGWSRLIKRSQAAAHHGMADEWADLMAEVHCRTWDDAGAALREFVRQARTEAPHAKQYTPGLCCRYLDRVKRVMIDRHRAVSASHLVEPAAKQVPAAKAQPEKRETVLERRNRVKSGNLSGLERYALNNGWAINEDGDLVNLKDAAKLKGVGLLPKGAREKTLADL
jgi:hypothetical protein